MCPFRELCNTQGTHAEDTGVGYPDTRLFATENISPFVIAAECDMYHEQLEQNSHLCRTTTEEAHDVRADRETSHGFHCARVRDVTARSNFKPSYS